MDNYGQSGPKPPDDPYLVDAIAKMADFVSRNGPEFENMTRQKQADNPKFSFLFPGDPHYSYYRYCVDRQMQHYNNSGGVAPQQTPQRDANTTDINMLQEQIAQMQMQIRQSEANLKAQKDSIPLIKEAQFSQAVIDAENGKIARLLQQVSLDVTPLANLMDQLNSKCSKETVSACKKWIFDYCVTDQMREIILMYLLHRVREPMSSDQFRLHILYLINDWAHYCQRKHLDGVTQMLSRYVPQMYAWISESTSDRSIVEKLEKLLGVWEGHKYFNDHCFKQLRNPQQIYATAKTALHAEHSRIAQNIEAQLTAMVGGYEQQHNDFCNHYLQQIAVAQQQIDRINNKDKTPSLLDMNVPPPAGLVQHQQEQQQQQQQNRRRSRFDQSAPAGQSRFGSERGGWQQDDQADEDEEDIDGEPFKEEDLIPKCEYWDTPAGLMLPLIDAPDVTYKMLEPSKIRLIPKKKAKSAKLRRALDMFYMDGPDRDDQGWTHGALAAFFDRKMHIKQLLEDKQKSDGKTFEDLITNKMTQEEIDEEMREHERARAEARAEVLAAQRKEESGGRRSRSSSSSSSSRSSRSRSRSSSRSSRSSRGRNRRSRTRSHSRSPRRRSRSRSDSRSPIRFRRSPTPEDILPLSAYSRSQNAPIVPLGADNKGAMLMQKMGWKGTGLGANETGIQEPITAGEVRDRGDQYRGLGQSSDQFEEYRKQRSSGYHNRNQAVFERRKHHTSKYSDEK